MHASKMKFHSSFNLRKYFVRNPLEETKGKIAYNNKNNHQLF